MQQLVKIPQQERSRQTMQNILDAGRELLISGGFDGFSVAQLSALSGVSVGSIYQRFGKKEEVYRMLQAGLLNEMDQKATARFEQVENPYKNDCEVIFDAIKRFCHHCIDNQQLLRALISRGMIDSAANERGVESSILIGKLFKQFLHTHMKTQNLKDPDFAYDICFRMIYSFGWRRIMADPTLESDTNIEWDQIVEELCAMCARYLRVE